MRILTIYDGKRTRTLALNEDDVDLKHFKKTDSLIQFENFNHIYSSIPTIINMAIVNCKYVNLLNIYSSNLIMIGGENELDPRKIYEHQRDTYNIMLAFYALGKKYKGLHDVSKLVKTFY